MQLYMMQCFEFFLDPIVLKVLIIVGWFCFAIITQAFVEFLTDRAEPE